MKATTGAALLLACAAGCEGFSTLGGSWVAAHGPSRLPGGLGAGGGTALRSHRAATSIALNMGGAGDDERRKERDGAIGFLSADSEYDTLGFRSIEALNRELAEAKQAAAEAEERAVVLRSSSGSSPGGAEKVENNGLSNMLTPIAVKMSQDKGNYLTGMRCPVREFQEALEVTKCGIMQYAGTLARDPATIGAVFIGMYLLTVACISAPPSEPPSPF